MLQQSIGHTRDIVDGALKTVNLWIDQHDIAFHQIFAKHPNFDDIVSRRPQQGKGSSSERTG